MRNRVGLAARPHPGTAAGEPRGAAMGAALVRPCAGLIRERCKRGGWRGARGAPAAVVLPAALEDEHFAWTDGRVVLEVRQARQQVESVRTRVFEKTDPAEAQ